MVWHDDQTERTLSPDKQGFYTERNFSIGAVFFDCAPHF